MTSRNNFRIKRKRIRDHIIRTFSTNCYRDLFIYLFFCFKKSWSCNYFEKKEKKKKKKGKERNIHRYNQIQSNYYFQNKMQWLKDNHDFLGLIEVIKKRNLMKILFVAWVDFQLVSNYGLWFGIDDLYKNFEILSKLVFFQAMNSNKFSFKRKNKRIESKGKKERNLCIIFWVFLKWKKKKKVRLWIMMT